jgi:hypothetical protein
MFGSLGVLVGTTLGLVAGSLFLSIGHIVASGLNWTRFIVPSGTAGLLAVSVGLALFSNGYGTIDHSLLSVLITSLCCAGLLILMGWFNPMRTWLLIPRA